MNYFLKNHIKKIILFSLIGTLLLVCIASLYSLVVIIAMEWFGGFVALLYTIIFVFILGVWIFSKSFDNTLDRIWNMLDGVK